MQRTKQITWDPHDKIDQAVLALKRARWRASRQNLTEGIKNYVRRRDLPKAIGVKSSWLLEDGSKREEILGALARARRGLRVAKRTSSWRYEETDALAVLIALGGENRSGSNKKDR